MKIRNSIMVIVTAFALSLGAGCKTTLQTGGAYAPTNEVGVATSAPDQAIYAADAAFKTTYDLADVVFSFERNNRQALWDISPDIKKAIDKARTEFWPMVEKWALARKAYLANPTPANLDTVQTVLAKTQQVVSAASAVITSDVKTQVIKGK